MYTQIKGLSDKRRLPRLGKIRLGVKAVSEKSGKEYPTETQYFVCPAEVQKVYGEKPTELDVLFPLEDTAITIPQAYEYYGTTAGLKCIGNGETAMRVDQQTGEMKERECPCEYLTEKKCSKRMHIRVILPQVNIGGIYQIDTSSFNSIIDINSSIDYVRALVGRIAMIPLKLKRVKTETHFEGKKQNHYTLKLEIDADMDFINTLRKDVGQVSLAQSHYSLPPMEAENPAFDSGATVVTEEAAREIMAETGAMPPKAEISVPTEKNKPTTDKIVGKITNITQKADGVSGYLYTITCNDRQCKTNDVRFATLAKTAKTQDITAGISCDQAGFIEKIDLI